MKLRQLFRRPLAGHATRHTRGRTQTLEWMMGWPVGWTSTREPLAMGKFHRWWTLSVEH